MLSVRLAVLTAIAGLCLWGLFSLLDNLNSPGLLRTEKAVVLKGCDEPGNADRDLCAQLRCQKSVLEQRRVPLRAQFQIERPSGRWIGGRALDARGQSVLGYFACEQQAGIVGPAQWLTREQFAALGTATLH
jgi:hypothetical protein